MHANRFIALVALMMATLLCAVVPASGHAHAVKPSDACTPFRPPAPFKDLAEYVGFLNTLSEEQLSGLFYGAPAPASDSGFPVAGCTIGWVPGGDIKAQFTRALLPTAGMGWSGKCFGFEYNTETGTPSQLMNEFSSEWLNLSLPMRDRMPAALAGKANVFWSASALDPAMKGAVWRFDYRVASPLVNEPMHMDFIVDTIRDEVRQILPGALLGRMYLHTKEDSPTVGVMPVFFALFQACTADGTYPTTPEARAYPVLGALN